MGSVHHFVPVSVLTHFATAEAASVVAGDKAKIRAAFETLMLQRSAYRRRPVVMVRKTPKGNSLSVAPAEDLCWSRHLYSLPSFSDPRERGIALSIVGGIVDFDLGVPKAKNDGELLRWAEAAGRSRITDEVLEDLLAKEIDGPAARALREVRRTLTLEDRHVPVFASFLEFALVRTRFWHEHNRTGMQAAALRLLHEFGPVEVKAAYAREASQFLKMYEEVAARCAYQMMVGTFLEASRRQLFARPPFRQVLLFAEGSVAFCISDNPARPFTLRAAHRIHRDPLPGFRDPGTWLIYPVAPRLALGITTSRMVEQCSTIRVGDPMVRTVNSVMLRLAVQDLVLPGVSTDLFLPGIAWEQIRPWQEHGNAMYATPPGFIER